MRSCTKIASEPNRDPALRVHTGSYFHGSQDWNAGRGDYCEDSSRIFRSRPADQGDLPRPWCLPEGGTEGYPFGGNRVSLRTRGATASEDRALDRQARSVAGVE